MNLHTNFFLKEKNPEIIVLNLLIFTVGFSIVFSYTFNSISIGLLFLWSFFWLKKHQINKTFLKSYKLHLLFLVYFVIQLAGVFYSNNLEEGFGYLVQNIVFLLFPITFFNISKVLDYRKLKLAIYGFLLGVLLVLLSIHYNIVVKMVSEGMGINSLLKSFIRVDFVNNGIVQVHPPYLGMLAAYCFCLVLVLDFFKNKTFNYLFKYSLGFYFLISIYEISSFMSMVLALVVFAGYCFTLIVRKSTSKKTKLIISVLTLVLIACVYKVNIREVVKGFPGESLLGRIEWSFYKEKGDTSRPENWRSVIQVVKSNPIFGIGSDGGLEYLQKFRSKRSESYINEHNAHNQYLETLLRHGLLGLLVYLLIIFFISKLAVISNNFCFIGFVFIFILASVTESYLVRQIGLTFFTFFTLLFSTYYSFNQKCRL